MEEEKKHEQPEVQIQIVINEEDENYLPKLSESELKKKKSDDQSMNVNSPLRMSEE